MNPRHGITGTALRALILAGFLGPVQTPAGAQSVPRELIEYPDAIYANATIVTLDNHEMNHDPGTVVGAVAMRDGTILNPGSHRDTLRLAGPDSEMVDLQGKKVLPGFVESHVHPVRSSIEIARDLFNLRSTPEDYALNMDAGATADETMVKVARATDQLSAIVDPEPHEWINVSLLHVPEPGFASPADVSTLMSALCQADVKIARSDLSGIVPDYPFVLSSASSILSAPEKNVWYHIIVGPEGGPITEPIVELAE